MTARRGKPAEKNTFFPRKLTICLGLSVPCLMFTRDDQDTDELPPFLNTWRKMYAAVLVNLLVLILLFHAFTRYFA